MDADIVSEWLSFAYLIVLLGATMVFMATLFKEISDPIIADYEDKTALASNGSLVPDFSYIDYDEDGNYERPISTDAELRGMLGQEVVYGYEIVFMVLNVDINNPYPRKIKIGNTTISLNSSAITEKGTLAQQAKNAVNLNSQYYMIFVDDENGDYWLFKKLGT